MKFVLRSTKEGCRLGVFLPPPELASVTTGKCLDTPMCMLYIKGGKCKNSGCLLIYICESVLVKSFYKNTSCGCNNNLKIYFHILCMIIAYM